MFANAVMFGAFLATLHTQPWRRRDERDFETFPRRQEGEPNVTQHLAIEKGKAFVKSNPLEAIRTLAVPCIPSWAAQ